MGLGTNNFNQEEKIKRCAIKPLVCASTTAVGNLGEMCPIQHWGGGGGGGGWMVKIVIHMLYTIFWHRTRHAYSKICNNYFKSCLNIFNLKDPPTHTHTHTPTSSSGGSSGGLSSHLGAQSPPYPPNSHPALQLPVWTLLSPPRGLPTVSLAISGCYVAIKGS